MPGFIRNVPFPERIKSELRAYGRQIYKERRIKGCMVVTLHHGKHKRRIIQKLKNTHTTAKYIFDSLRNVVYHYFFIPASALQQKYGYGGFDPVFVRFVSHPLSTPHFVPVIKQSLSEMPIDPRKKQEVVSQGYFVL